MSEEKNEESAGGKRWLCRLTSPTARYSVLTILIVGFIGGIIFWGGFNTGMEATNTMQFCTGCHEMHDTVYQEYKETIHYTNRTGVRATCSDCHVPKDWTHKMIRKAKASFEVWGKITGKIDTPEKFEAERFAMAKREWARMEASGSAECKNCHSFEGMMANKQKKKAQAKHKEAQEQGKTCINCHKGIAHLLPAEYEEPEDDE